MNTVPRPDREPAEVHIQLGDVHAARRPTVIKTLLGSCVAACLFDPVAGVGGMNHFMLPAPGRPTDGAVDADRFGVHAMDCLIGALQRAGADRRRLQAKVFGGGEVLALASRAESIAQRNIRFVEHFLEVENIPLVNRDVGGSLPRQLHFHTDSGRAYVRRLHGVSGREVAERERARLESLATQSPPYGDITLFDR